MNVAKKRRFEPNDMTKIISALRAHNGWSQDTLAELSGLSVRTVQRVEDKGICSLHTRRALARAFGCEDIDFFNKPIPDELIEDHLASIEKDKAETVTLKANVIKNGRILRELSESADLMGFDQMGELPEDVERTLAFLKEFLQEYDLAQDLITPTQKLDVNKQIDDILSEFDKWEYNIVYAQRKVRLNSENNAEISFSCDSVVLLVCPKNRIPEFIRVPKKDPVRFSL